jgi:hypothetical protein
VCSSDLVKKIVIRDIIFFISTEYFFRINAGSTKI